MRACSKRRTDRLWILLIGSQVLRGTGFAALYYMPSLEALGLIGVGFFMRLMAPMRVHGDPYANISMLPLLGGTMASTALSQWLDSHGLNEVIMSAIADRFSLIPMTAVTLLVLSVFAAEIWEVDQMRPSEIEQYYAS